MAQTSSGVLCGTNVTVGVERVESSGDPGAKQRAVVARVDRDTISDRDWLAYLDDRVASLFDLMDAVEKRRVGERDEFARRLSGQRDDLRAEIVREARNGWQLVAWGLLYGFTGFVLGAFA